MAMSLGTNVILVTRVHCIVEKSRKTSINPSIGDCGKGLLAVFAAGLGRGYVNISSDTLLSFAFPSAFSVVFFFFVFFLFLSLLTLPSIFPGKRPTRRVVNTPHSSALPPVCPVIAYEWSEYSMLRLYKTVSVLC